MDTKMSLTPVKRFWMLLKPDKKEIRNVYVYAIFNGLVNLSLPIGIQSIINLIQGGQMSTSWIVLVVFVILGITITGILQISQLRITEHLQQKIFTRAAFEFAYRIPRIKLEALYHYYAPELMNRFFDVVSVQKGLSKVLIDFSTAGIQVIFGLVLLSLYHPFFIVFSLTLVIMVYFIFRLTAKRGLDTSLDESKNKYNVAHWLQELARTRITFMLAGPTQLPLNRINDKVDKYIDARENHFKVLVQQYALMIVFKVTVAAGLLVIGSLLVIEQQMNIGQFVAAEIIILLVVNSVEKLILSIESIYDVLTSLEKIGQVTDLELEDEEKGMDITNCIDSEGLSVELNNVRFMYPDKRKAIFDGASMRVEAREKVLVMGNTDSGKSTLLYLMAGLYDLEEGDISYNNLPLGNLDRHKLRSVIGDCLMDEQLFEGTILENITMGRERATFENVQWAVKNLGLESFIKKMPMGYNTWIHSGGRQFSKGVIDKLLIARSIADRPSLLLIKDTFTSLIGQEREQIMSFLTSKEQKWTLVITSKDENLIDKVDRVITVENNLLIEKSH